jgi:hypothetical protein
LPGTKALAYYKKFVNYGRKKFYNIDAWPFKAPATPPIRSRKHHFKSFFSTTARCIGGQGFHTFPPISNIIKLFLMSFSMFKERLVSNSQCKQKITSFRGRVAVQKSVFVEI